MRLDGWFQLLYSFPSIFVGMRWSPRIGTLTVLASWFWVNFTLGPFSGLSYITSQGLSTLVLLFGLWNNWPTAVIFSLSVLAKMIGFFTLIAIISIAYAMNVLEVLSKQVSQRPKNTHAAT